MDFLDKVNSQLDEADRRRLREILFDDSPLPTPEQVEADLDSLRVQQLRQELTDVQACIEASEFRGHLPALIAYQRGLRRLLEPGRPALRKMFFLYRQARYRQACERKADVDQHTTNESGDRRGQ